MSKRSPLSIDVQMDGREQFTARSRIKPSSRERGRTNVTWFVGINSHYRLKEMTLEKDTTLQQIINEAMNDWLVKEGEKPLESISFKKGEGA